MARPEFSSVHDKLDYLFDLVEEKLGLKDSDSSTEKVPDSTEATPITEGQHAS
jgi:hypothetical protein